MLSSVPTSHNTNNYQASTACAAISAWESCHQHIPNAIDTSGSCRYKSPLARKGEMWAPAVMGATCKLTLTSFSQHTASSIMSCKWGDTLGTANNDLYKRDTLLTFCKCLRILSSPGGGLVLCTRTNSNMHILGSKKGVTGQCRIW